MTATNIVDDLFSKEVQLNISKVCDSDKEYLQTNHQRADMMTAYLRQEGFKEIGCGTNRIVYTHPNMDDRVFKIALDSRGIADNNMEEKLFDELIKIVPQFFDNNGLILVAERVRTFRDKAEYIDNDDIQPIIDSLVTGYIINDIGPSSFLNWGVDKMGRTVILDYAYITPMLECKTLECRKCGGALDYTDDLNMIKCTNKKCKALYSISDITGSHVDTLTQLGFKDETFTDEIKSKVDMVLGETADRALDKLGFSDEI